MAVMGPVLSWAVFLSVIGAVYYLSQRKTEQPVAVAGKPLVQEKGKQVFAGSGTDTGEPKKKKGKKAKKSALSNAAAKEVVSTDDGGNKSDDDVAEEIDVRDVAKRLRASQSGKSASGSRRPYAASQTSSTGADGDIDEEEASAGYPAKSSSSDPRDMLEAPSGGPGVLRIGAAAQLPRGQKKKTTSAASELGVHANKNAKKKEKKKADRDVERAEQQARFEQHRKSARAEEAAQQKSKPVQAAPVPDSSAWTEVSAKKSAPAALAAPTLHTPPSTLLDTFTPAGSDNETIQQSTTLSESWESIPTSAMAPEPEWSQVKSKKARKDRKADDSDARSGDDAVVKPRAPEPAPVIKPRAAKPPVVQQKKAAINYNILDTNASDARTTSGSDWEKMDKADNWPVHPESSDF